jgi:aspartyl aminopeptidase
MDSTAFNEGLMRFLDASPTPFHAVAGMVDRLEAAGFRRLSMHEPWRLEPGGAWLATVNDSSLVAFTTGERAAVDDGLRIVGAHTDSPCLRIKPAPENLSEGSVRLGIEVYGGALLNPWFDRDLGLAGRVTWRDRGGSTGSSLVHLAGPVAVIPSLAIHLDREVNRQRSVNPQTDLQALLMQSAADGERPSLRNILLGHLHERRPDPGVAEVLDYELSLADCQPAALVGLNREYLASARLDNLLSCYCGLTALTASSRRHHAVLVCNDHEEVGSQSASGADGPFLTAVLERMCGGREAFQRIIHRSLMISADNAHAVHPNYADRHDPSHRPRLNGGPVIKVNAGQRYATSSVTAAAFRELCRRVEVPVQVMAMRSDMACGSTIGPITAAVTGIATVDVGVPQLAMHSIRELAGACDGPRMATVLTAFYDTDEALAVS